MVATWKAMSPFRSQARTIPLATERYARKTVPAQEVPQHLHLPQCGSLNLLEVSVEGLQQLMSTDQLSSETYVAFCLERIFQVNQYLKAVIEVNPDALELARRLDSERRDGNVRSRLHGIPVLVKDNIATKDQMQTTAGSWALLGSTVPRDAHIVHRLREAGAVLLGHANMSEWASVRSSTDSTGYSPRGDQTRNPYDLTRSPKGSSSGSAVAVSANIVPLAYGTETDTSIIGPAQVAGVVGIKPTVGVTSRSGVIPISTTMDTVGPFGRTVADAALGLSIIAGTDSRDPATLDACCLRDVDYTNSITNNSVLKGAVFGLPMKRCWEFVKPSHKAVADRILDAMRDHGAEILPTEFPSWEDRIPANGQWNWQHGPPDQSEYTVVKVDAYNDINKYLADLENTTIKTLDDVVQYNIKNAGSEGGRKALHPAFPHGQDLFEDIVTFKGRQDETYEAALAYTRRKCREEGIDRALQRDSDVPFDALLLCDSRGIGQQIAAQAGYPIITVPIGIDDEGIPISLSLQQSAWREAELIKWASAVEDVVKSLSGGRPLPTFRHATAKNIPIDGYD